MWLYIRWFVSFARSWPCHLLLVDSHQSRLYNARPSDNAEKAGRKFDEKTRETREIFVRHVLIDRQFVITARIATLPFPLSLPPYRDQDFHPTLSRCPWKWWFSHAFHCESPLFVSILRLSPIETLSSLFVVSTFFNYIFWKIGTIVKRFYEIIEFTLRKSYFSFFPTFVVIFHNYLCRNYIYIYIIICIHDTINMYMVYKTRFRKYLLLFMSNSYINLVTFQEYCMMNFIFIYMNFLNWICKRFLKWIIFIFEKINCHYLIAFNLIFMKAIDRYSNTYLNIRWTS